MPLDTRSIDLSRLNALSGSLASYVFDEETVTPVGDSDPKEIATANSTFGYWKALCIVPRADLLCLRGPDRVSVASRRGGIIVEASKPLNVGLLRGVLKSHAPVNTGWRADVELSNFDAAQRTTWALTCRLGRVEAPRNFEMLVGEAEYVLIADKDGFGIVDQDGGVARLRDKIADAVTSGGQVEYTFGSLRDVAPTSRHSVTELVTQDVTNETLRLSQHGWPVAAPPDLPFEALQSIMAVGQMAQKEGLDSIELRDGVGQPVVQIQRNQTDAEFSGVWQIDQAG